VPAGPVVPLEPEVPAAIPVPNVTIAFHVPAIVPYETRLILV
jgi:hypothetical protein